MVSCHACNIQCLYDNGVVLLATAFDAFCVEFVPYANRVIIDNVLVTQHSTRRNTVGTDALYTIVTDFAGQLYNWLLNFNPFVAAQDIVDTQYVNITSAISDIAALF